MWILSLYILSLFYFFVGMWGGGGVGGDGENMAASLMLGQSLFSKKNENTTPTPPGAESLFI